MDSTKEVFVCDVCGAIIYEGETFYDINGDKWCEECVKNAAHIA